MWVNDAGGPGILAWILIGSAVAIGAVITVLGIFNPRLAWRWKNKYQFANADSVEPSDLATAWTRGTSIVAVVIMAAALVVLGFTEWGKSQAEQREELFGDDEVTLLELDQVSGTEVERKIPVEISNTYFLPDHDAISLVDGVVPTSTDLLITVPFKAESVVVEEAPTSVTVTVYGKCLRPDYDAGTCRDELHTEENLFAIATYAVPLNLDGALSKRAVIDGSTDKTLRQET